jgi:hypothetical protein
MEISNDIASGKLNPKIYRGENAYQNYLEQSEDILRQKKYSGTLKGP